MESPIITLTTDWNISDFFVGKVKGRLLSLLPNARIIDITHSLIPYDVQRAIFITRNACCEYPQGTIHIIDIATNYMVSPRYLAIECDGQYYICEDNGLPSALFSGRDFHAYDIGGILWSSAYRTFPALDLFCKVAAMLAQDFGIEEFGPPVLNLFLGIGFGCIVNPDFLRLHIAYFDHYGNAYLDITYDDFERVRNGRTFTMNVNEHRISSIQFEYIKNVNSESKNQGRLILTVSSTSHLQLAVVGHSAEQLLGLRNVSTIPVMFNNVPTSHTSNKDVLGGL